MSDLTATSCGCGGNSPSNDSGCGNILWIIILLCGNSGSGCGGNFLSGNNDGCGCGGNILWILILLCCCNNN